MIDDMVTRFLDRFDNCCKRRCCQYTLHYTGVCCSLVAIVCIFVANGYYTCPALYTSEQCTGPLAFGYFILLEIFVNFALFHYGKKFNKVDSLLPAHGRRTTDDFKSRGTLPVINPTVYQDLRYTGQKYVADQPAIGVQSYDGPPGVKFCPTCNVGVPWRSHHCPLCGYCVLKKDHHCYFTGGCVGFGNQRYFLVFLFWAFVGAAYGSSLTLRYLDAFYQPFWPFGWIDYIFPLAVKKWLIYQHCSPAQLITIFLCSAGLATAGVCLVFSALQWTLIYKGKTLMEQQSRKTAENFGQNSSSFRQNIQMVFGPYWIVNYLIPLPCKNKRDESFKKWLYDFYVKEL